MTNTFRIATLKAVTAVLIGLFSVIGLVAQTSIEEKAHKYLQAEKRRTAMVDHLVVRIAYFAGGTDCKFVGNVEEVGGVTWTNLELLITLSGNENSIDIPIRIDSIAAHQHQEVKASCHDKSWPIFNPTDLTAKRVNGTPTQTIKGNILDRFDADIAKLPILNVGSNVAHFDGAQSASVAFLASDRKCAQEFQQVFSMEGMEKGKRINELIQYHCGFIIDVPVRLELLSLDMTEAIDDGAVYIKVTVADCASGLKNCPVGNEKAKGKTGWVPTKWVTNY
jgi:hypothetical protein